MCNDRYSAVIVEDEPHAAAYLEDALSKDKDFEKVRVYGDGHSAVRTLRSERCDIALLDINLPGVDGMQIAKALGPENTTAVIFTTAIAGRVMESFEHHPIDYLLKPFSEEQLRSALDRAKGVVQVAREAALYREVQRIVRSPSQALSDAEQPGSSLERIMLRVSGRVVLLAPDEILWIESAGYCSRVYTKSTHYLVRESMASLESRLPADRFLRVHRCCMVQIREIREVRPDAHGAPAVVLGENVILPVSRSRYPALRDLAASLAHA